MTATNTAINMTTNTTATTRDASSAMETRRRSSAADGLRPDPNADAVATTTFAPVVCKPQDRTTQKSDDAPPAPIMPPLAPIGPDSTARPSCSHAGACRTTNRLSLTLPIAPPTGHRSRPTPTTASSYSVPPTPVETPTIPPPADANEFIIAIAAQERRVLELREDLVRAEADLGALKEQWTAMEPFSKPGAVHHAELHINSVAGTLDDGATGPRRSVDLDRRKLLLQNQNQGTPTQGNRRRLFHGGHTRALSLLSPSRPNSEFSIHETHGREAADPTAVQHALKRASWQPRSVQNSPSVPQIFEDFKLGLKALVEDVRQKAVGDEPVGQQGSATNRGAARGLGGPRTSFAPLGPNSNMATPTPSSRFAAEKPKPVKSKPFLWTPLAFDSMTDKDLSNWEHSAGLEDIGFTPEMREERIWPVKAQAANAEALRIDTKLGEISIPNVVRGLSPRRFMDEWERSLIAPGSGDKENNPPET